MPPPTHADVIAEGRADERVLVRTERHVTGEHVGAATALEWGLVNEVVPHDER